MRHQFNTTDTLQKDSPINLMISINKHSETVGIKNSQQKQAHGWTDIYCGVKGKKNRKERYMHSEITNNNNDHQQATEERGHIFCFVLMILMFIHSLLLCSLSPASLHRQRSPCLPLTNHLLQFTHLNTRPAVCPGSTLGPLPGGICPEHLHTGGTQEPSC